LCGTPSGRVLFGLGIEKAGAVVEDDEVGVGHLRCKEGNAFDRVQPRQGLLPITRDYAERDRIVGAERTRDAEGSSANVLRYHLTIDVDDAHGLWNMPAEEGPTRRDSNAERCAKQALARASWREGFHDVTGPKDGSPFVAKQGRTRWKLLFAQLPQRIPDQPPCDVRLFLEGARSDQSF
jgi:hypothetical protein